MYRRTLAFLSIAIFAAALYAGSTGTTALHTPNGSGSGTANGDYLSDAGGLNTFYRYFIEVPPGLTYMQVDLFDADLGAGGANEDTAGRDRDRNGYDTTVTYSLRDPSGTVVTPRFTTGSTTLPTGADNAWLMFFARSSSTVADNFGTAAYTNNDGTANWSGSWTETDGGGGGATGGSIQITGGELRLQDVHSGTQSIQREADLNGTPGLNLASAFFAFDFRTSNTLDNNDEIDVEVSSNGGGSWTTLETFVNDSSGSRQYDITAFIANNTRVRFVVNGLTASDEFFFVDNLRIFDGPVTAGHWELRVDMNADDDINALGIRAHDGTTDSGGTELNIYADSMIELGINPPNSGTNTRSYDLFPYITSGCNCNHNDFDLDTNSGTTGSMLYTSRTGAFSQTFASAVLSGNNVWNRETISGWVDDDDVLDYGIWSLDATVSSYTVGGTPNGNYTTLYDANSQAAANPPGANPVSNGFRIYLPTDAGTAPLKPYLQQELTNTFDTGAPAIGVPQSYTVTVRIVNPTPHAITFSNANLVTANVPGGGVVYAGNATVSQGSILSQPSVGGTGNVTWNPGTVAAGDDILMAYRLTITPTSNARIAVTGTPASGNGTRAQFVDETGNTTQARATFLAGPLCELAVTVNVLTEVLLSKFSVDVRGGGANIEFATASEAGTVGFNVYRADGTKVNDALIPASLKPHGGKYSVFDRIGFDADATYIVEEITSSGVRKRYGPINRLDGFDREQKREERAGQRRLKSTATPPWSVESNAKEKIIAAMVGVRATGIVRVPATDLASALGVNVSSVQKALGKGDVKVTSNGTAVAWTTDGSSLLFFGEKSASIYSNDRVYRVELASGVTMQAVNVGGVNVAVSTFQASQDFESDVFAATVLPLDPESDYWFWDFVISGDATFGRKTFNVNVPSVASSSGATLSVRLQGAFKDTTHHARVFVNGVPIGEATWSSFDAQTKSLAVPAALLRDGANDIEVEGLLEEGAGLDIFYVDGFTLTYQRNANPVGGQIEVRATGAVAAGPFNAAPMILDVTNRNRPALLQGAMFNGGTASLVANAKTKDLFFSESFVAPSFVRGSAEVKLKGRLRADWVVIAPRNMRAAAESLARLRSNEGLSTLVADLEQIYDEFAGGNTTPHAIKEFYKSTRNWDKPPRYFVLAGNGTVDYRGIEVAPGLVPPMMTSTMDGLYASDSLFVDRNGDRLPDIAIGRIPVSSADELEAYVAKLEANDNINSSNSSIVFSADAIDRGVDFRNASATAEQPLGSRPKKRVYVDELGSDGARMALINAWQSGAPLVSWVGHGGLDQISSLGILSSFDASSLQSVGHLPVLVAMTCTINRFENGFVDPLGVALTREQGAGAVAVWSASGLSNHAEASNIQNAFMRLAAQNEAPRIGDLIVKSLAAHAGDTSSVYLLLGDPAIRLALPAEVRNGGGPSTPGE